MVYRTRVNKLKYKDRIMGEGCMFSINQTSYNINTGTKMMKTKNKNINVYALRENLLTIDATNVFRAVNLVKMHN
jgi:hypothetical protein